ncbi:RsiV family protein [Mycolicibacterium llatzerense]|uniref:RsiV family protein n=1 Tax=Mycolicibacterium llatzerense TaxID=280871 RepID=UPI001F33902F|nr:RsiV family protein [Mycolicibacterium llatzerense]
MSAMPLCTKAATPMFAALLGAILGAAGIAVADTGTSAGAAYTVSTTAIDSGGWHVTLSQLSGGNSAVTTAFNSASRASAQTMASMLDVDHVIASESAFSARPTVSFRPTAVAQVLTGTYYWRRAAHPLNYVTTVVIDTRTAAPITVDDLFADTRAGLNKLSQQTKLIFPAKYGHATPMGEELGNAPLEKNFHNWIPTATGLEIHFEDGQFGHGLPVITVPWSQLIELLAPDMRGLAQ